MPALLNPKHEMMAQGLAQGLTSSPAYEKAGFKPNPSNASRLAKSDKIKSRLAEIRTIVAGKEVDDIKFDVRHRLTRIAEISVLAQAAKDFKTALMAELTILDALGYKDNPSMVHDHLNTGLRNAFKPDPAPPPDGQTQAPEAPVQAPRFTGAIDFLQARKMGGGAA